MVVPRLHLHHISFSYRSHSHSSSSSPSQLGTEALSCFFTLFSPSFFLEPITRPISFPVKMSPVSSMGKKVFMMYGAFWAVRGFRKNYRRGSSSTFLLFACSNVQVPLYLSTFLFWLSPLVSISSRTSSVRTHFGISFIPFADRIEAFKSHRCRGPLPFCLVHRYTRHLGFHVRPRCWLSAIFMRDSHAAIIRLLLDIGVKDSVTARPPFQIGIMFVLSIFWLGWNALVPLPHPF